MNQNLPIERNLSPADLRNLEIAFDEGSLAHSLDQAQSAVYEIPNMPLDSRNLALPHLSRSWDELAASVDDFLISNDRLRENKVVNGLLDELFSLKSNEPDLRQEMLLELQSVSQKQPYKPLFDDYLQHFDELKSHYQDFGKIACDTINQLPVDDEIKSSHLQKYSDDLDMLSEMIKPCLIQIKPSGDMELLPDFNKTIRDTRTRLVVAPQQEKTMASTGSDFDL